MSKTHEAAYELLEELASNNYQWPTERAMPRKTARVLELDSITSLVAQMATFSQQLGKMNVNAIKTNVVCDHCAGNHSSVNCQVDGRITPTSHGAITKGRLNHLSNFHSKRRSRHLRTCSCSTYRRQTWRSKTTQLQFVILRCRSVSSQACSQRGL